MGCGEWFRRLAESSSLSRRASSFRFLSAISSFRSLFVFSSSLVRSSTISSSVRLRETSFSSVSRSTSTVEVRCRFSILAMRSSSLFWSTPATWLK